jgi:hypothetical protein
MAGCNTEWVGGLNKLTEFSLSSESEATGHKEELPTEEYDLTQDDIDELGFNSEEDDKEDDTRDDSDAHMEADAHMEVMSNDFPVTRGIDDTINIIEPCGVPISQVSVHDEVLRKCHEAIKTKTKHKPREVELKSTCVGEKEYINIRYETDFVVGDTSVCVGKANVEDTIRNVSIISFSIYNPVYNITCKCGSCTIL